MNLPLATCTPSILDRPEKGENEMKKIVLEHMLFQRKTVSARRNYRKVFFEMRHQIYFIFVNLIFKNGCTYQSQDGIKGTLLYRSLNLVIDLLHSYYVKHIGPGESWLIIEE